MEKRYRAQDIYNSFRKEEEADPPRPTRTVLQPLFQLLVEFLSLCKPQDKFSFHEFHKILNLSCAESDFNLRKASEAFETLEFYLATIWKNSWKPEFKRIRVSIDKIIIYNMYQFLSSSVCMVYIKTLKYCLFLAIEKKDYM